MAAIFKREFKNYFTSVIGYVFFTLFMIFYGVFFYVSIVGGEKSGVISSGMSNFFGFIYFVLVLLIPVLTMRLFSEERKQKTDQLLLTSPVGLGEIVIGKFLSAFAIYSIAVGTTAFFAIIIALFGKLDFVQYIGMVIGILLIGAALIAIGEFISALTESQVVAAFATFGAIILTFVPVFLSSIVSSSLLKTLLGLISLHSRYTDFTSGIFDLGNILFYLSFTAVFLFLTVRVTERRRWS
ncbi:MAG: ABC transporter permease subunit [Clostridia bacterium]|nr:ABC transporter permease subunit [Clostridia bacterium]MBR5942531.1 ABC transporter permease subunit [Clostridia bacterium]